MRVKNNHPKILILGNKNEGVETRRMLAGSPKQVNISLLSLTKPKTFAEASKYYVWIKAMNEELD